MAGRPARSKTQLTVQQRESQCRAKWTTSLTNIMVEVMVNEVHGGHKQNKSFSKKGWKCICDEFRKRTGLTWERDQLKYRYAALRKLFATIKLLLDHADFKWDETTGLITATDEAWDQYIKVCSHIFCCERSTLAARTQFSVCKLNSPFLFYFLVSLIPRRFL